MLKVTRVISDLAFIIYRTKIDTCESRTIPLTKARGLVLTKGRIRDRFSDIFEDLRG